MEAKGCNFFSLKTFCVVTGASKGYGQCIAVQFASLLPKDSFMFLMARSEDGLKKTKQTIEEKSPDVRVKILPVDLGDQDKTSFDNIFQQAFTECQISASTYDQGIIVHNAASLGDVSQNMSQHDDVMELGKFWQLNLTSMLTLNSVFLKYFTEENMKQRLVINLSSICALQPFRSWSLYCSAKSARDMLLRSLAVEEPSIRVLNYAPGPIDTDMQILARTQTADDEIRDMFIDMHNEGRLLSSEQSVAKLLKLLQENKFDSGSHIDYYDI